MTPDSVLLVFVILFWAVLAIATKLQQVHAGRSFADGPSLFPIVPMLVIVSLLIGMAINRWLPPYGTATVLTLHISGLFVSLVLLLRNRENQS